ncbi:hypothetical protein AB0F81_14850 [Actinoplanes sp. NPDC024001]|uniref:hypothetical protein n=1 Tax=Actinoplanes sp. NPDC024001 TaxID=3154598 RepID=UPI0033E8CB41
MRDEEIIERIRIDRRHDATPARIGRHDVVVETVRLGAAVGELTTVFRVRDGVITLLRAARGTFRADVAATLLDTADRMPGDLGGVVHVAELRADGLALDRAAVFRPSQAFNDPELASLTVAAVPVHRSEVREGETTAAFEETTGKLMRLPVNEWDRQPKPRAHARLLDDWPGGRMRKVKKPGMWPAERLFTEVAPDLGIEVRLEATDVRGHRLVLSRTWDRLTGVLTLASDTEKHASSAETHAGDTESHASSADTHANGTEPYASSADTHANGTEPHASSADTHASGTEILASGAGRRAEKHPVDVPRLAAWPALEAIFAGREVRPADLTVAGTPETDVLDVTFQTAARGWAGAPRLDTLADALSLLTTPGLHTPGDWAAFTSRSGTVVQVRCEDDGRLWLESPDARSSRSLGRHVTVDEASRMVTILAREDRSAVAELGGLSTVSWG